VKAGKTCNNDEVSYFLQQLETYTTQNFIKGLNEIFRPDGEYPEFVEPNEPNDPRDKIAFEKWKADHKRFNDSTDRLENEKPKLFGVIWGQLGKGSQERIRQTTDGKEAEERKQPQKLIKAIIATHFTAGKTDSQ
jgi:hypothetical protein